MPDNSSSSPSESLSDLHAIPWAHTILTSPSWRQIPSISRRFHTETTENTFLANTTFTPSTIRALVTLISHPTPDSLVILASLGSGLNGWNDTLHGGVVAALLDEVAGSLITEVWPGTETLTAGLNVRFVGRVGTPGVVLCRAWGVRVEGRKCWVSASVEDGEGKVLATGEALFVRVKEESRKGLRAKI